MASEGETAIDLRNLDGVNLEEGESENGGDAKGPAVWGIIKMRYMPIQLWNTFFILISSFAVFVDPLLCYVFVTREEFLCFKVDYKLLLAYAIMRLCCDIFYVIDIVIFCRENWEEVRTKQYKIILWIIIRILVALPIPVVIITAFRITSHLIYCLIITTTVQLTLRIVLICKYQLWLPMRWLIRPLVEFFPFILASYLFGAAWYGLAVLRQTKCWMINCDEVAESPTETCGLDLTYFDCAYSMMTVQINTTRLNEVCPSQSSDPKVFDFGIYLYAVQSSVTSSSHIYRRTLQSFWWALRNLSSFGSNLQTSMDPAEIIFSVIISICGMMLFLVYLNERVQESLARTNERKLKRKKHFMTPDIDLWLFKNNLSKMKRRTDLKTKSLKTVIVDNIERLEENKGVDLQLIISVLPIKFRKSITCLLCFTTLKKVPTLANLSNKMLKVICEYLKPVTYGEGSIIVEEGKPLCMVLFITQGLLWSYITDGRRFDSSSWLKQGDFCGEELLNWAFKSPSFSALPISSKTIMSQENVEAFALRVSDLRSIVRKFWWHFTKELEQVELEQWENLAASSIQGAWRNRLAKARRSNRWNNFSVEN